MITFGKRTKKNYFPVRNDKNEDLSNNTSVKTHTSPAKKNQLLTFENEKCSEIPLLNASLNSKSDVVGGTFPNCGSIALKKSPKHKRTALKKSPPNFKNTSSMKSSLDGKSSTLVNPSEEDFALSEVVPNLKTYSRSKVNVHPEEHSDCKQIEGMTVVNTSIANQADDDHLLLQKPVDLKSITLPCYGAVDCYNDSLVNFSMDISDDSIYRDLQTEDNASSLFNSSFRINTSTKKSSSPKLSLTIKNERGETELSQQNTFMSNHLPQEKALHFEMDSEITNKEKTNSDANQNLSNIKGVMPDQELAYVRKKPSALKVKVPQMRALKNKSNTKNLSLTTNQHDVKKKNDSNLNNFVQSLNSGEMKEDSHHLQSSQENCAPSSSRTPPGILFNNENDANTKQQNQSSVIQKSETIELVLNQSKVHIIDPNRNAIGASHVQHTLKHEDKCSFPPEDKTKQVVPLLKKTEDESNRRKQSKISIKRCMPDNVQRNLTEEQSDQSMENDIDTFIETSDHVTHEKGPVLCSQKNCSSETFTHCNLSLAQNAENGESNLIIKSEMPTRDKKCESVISNQTNFLVSQKAKCKLNVIGKAEHNEEDSELENDKLYNTNDMVMFKEIKQKQQFFDSKNKHPISPNKKTSLTLKEEEHLTEVANKIMLYISQKSKSVVTKKDEETVQISSSNNIETITTKPDLVNKWHSVQDDQNENPSKNGYSVDQKTQIAIESYSQVPPLKFVINKQYKMLDQKFISTFSTEKECMQPVVSLINFVKDTDKFTKQLKNANECRYVSEALKYFDNSTLSVEKNPLELNNELRCGQTELYKELSVETNVQQSTAMYLSTSDDDSGIYSKNEISRNETNIWSNKWSMNRRSPQGKLIHAYKNQETTTRIESSEDKDICFPDPESKKRVEVENKQLKPINKTSDVTSVKDNDNTCEDESLSHTINWSSHNDYAKDLCAKNFFQSEKQELDCQNKCTGDQDKGNYNSSRRKSPRKQITQDNVKIALVETKECEEYLNKSNQNTVNKRKENVSPNFQGWQQAQVPEVTEKILSHSKVESKQTTPDACKKITVVDKKPVDLENISNFHEEETELNLKGVDSLNVEKEQTNRANNCLKTKKKCSKTLFEVSLTQSDQEPAEVNKYAQVAKSGVTKKSIFIKEVDEQKSLIQHTCNDMKLQKYFRNHANNIKSASISAISNDVLNETNCGASSKSSGSSAFSEESVSETEFPSLSVQEELFEKESKFSAVSELVSKPDCLSSKFLKSLQLLPKDSDDIHSQETSSQVRYKQSSIPEKVAEHFKEKEEKASLHELQKRKRYKKDKNTSPKSKKPHESPEKNEIVHEQEPPMGFQICDDKRESSSVYKEAHYEAKLQKDKLSVGFKPPESFCSLKRKQSKPITVYEPFFEDSNVNELNASGSKEESFYREKRNDQQHSNKTDNMYAISASSSNIPSPRMKRRHESNSSQIPEKMFLGKRVRSSNCLLEHQNNNDSESEENEVNKTVNNNRGRFSNVTPNVKTDHDFRNKIINEKRPESSHAKEETFSERPANRTAGTQTPYDQNMLYVHPNAGAMMHFNPFRMCYPQFASPFSPYYFMNSPLNPYSSYFAPNPTQNPSFQQASGCRYPSPVNTYATPQVNPQEINAHFSTDDSGDSHSVNKKEDQQVLRSKCSGDMLFTDFIFFCTDVAFVNTKSFIEANKASLLNPYVEKKDVYSMLPVKTFCTSPMVMDTLSKLTCNKRQDFPEPALIEYSFRDGFENEELLKVIKEYVKFHFIHIKKRYPLQLKSGRFNNRMLQKYTFKYLSLRDTLFMRLLCSEKEEKYTLTDLFLILSVSAMLTVFDEFKKGTFVSK